MILRVLRRVMGILSGCGLCRRAMAKVPQIEPLKLALSPEEELADMVSARNDLYNPLKGLKVIIIKNRKAARVGFTKEEAVEITNLIFVEVMRVQARQQVILLIRYYNDYKDDIANLTVSL